METIVILKMPHAPTCIVCFIDLVYDASSAWKPIPALSFRSTESSRTEAQDVASMFSSSLRPPGRVGHPEGGEKLGGLGGRHPGCRTHLCHLIAG